MKQQQVIMGSITATVSAIALGYLGVQYLNQTTMYTVAGAMLGLGATTQVTQLKSKSHVRKSQLLLPPSLPVITVSEEPPQLMQASYQSIEQKFEDRVEVIEQEVRDLLAESKGDSKYGDSTPRKRKPLNRSEGKRPKLRSASQQGEGVISSCSLPPSPCLLVESDSSQELNAEIDPIIERFLKLGLEEF